MALAQSHPPQPALRSSAPLGPSLTLRSSAQLWPLALPHRLLPDSCASDHVFPCVPLVRLPLARLPLQDSCASDHVFLFPPLWLVLSQHAPLVLPRGPRSSSPSPPPSPISLT